VDDGPSPGDVEGIASILDAIATRATPTGDILARGMDDALAAFGMSEWTITSKHMDPAGYDPRRLRGMALSYAVSVRGPATCAPPSTSLSLVGCWKVSTTMPTCRLHRLGRSHAADGQPDHVPLLPRPAYVDRILSAVAQLNEAPVTKEQLERLCTDTITRIRRFNLACGATPADDTVAERFFREPTDSAPVVDRDGLRRQVEIYWTKRGWGRDGLVPD